MSRKFVPDSWGKDLASYQRKAVKQARVSADVGDRSIVAAQQKRFAERAERDRRKMIELLGPEFVP